MQQAPTPTPRPRLGHLHAQRYFASPFAALPSGHTYAITMAFDAPFDRVRLVYANDGPTPYLVENASVATASRLGDGVNPDGPWTQASFKSAGAANERFVAQNPNVLLVPGTQDANLPSLAYSDWIDVIPRAGSQAWLMCRSSFSGPARGVLPPPPGFAHFNTNPAHASRHIHAFHDAP